MKSEDLAQHVEDMTHAACGPYPGLQDIIDAAKSRIMGVGHEQYSEGDKQKFELVPFDVLLGWAEEETIDQINYGVMALVRLHDSLAEFDPNSTSVLEMNCLDLIENGVIQTQRIRDMRETLAHAQSK